MQTAALPTGNEELQREAFWREWRQASRERREKRLATLLRKGLRERTNRERTTAPAWKLSDGFEGAPDPDRPSGVYHEGDGGVERVGRRARLKLRDGMGRAIPKCVIHIDPLPALWDERVRKSEMLDVMRRKSSGVTQMTAIEGIPERWTSEQVTRGETEFSFTPIEGVLERMMPNIAPSLLPLSHNKRSSHYTAIEGIPERHWAAAGAPSEFQSNQARMQDAYVQRHVFVEGVGSTGGAQTNKCTPRRRGHTKESRNDRTRTNEIQPCLDSSGSEQPSFRDMMEDGAALDFGNGMGSGIRHSGMASLHPSAAASVVTMTDSEIIDLDDASTVLDRRTTGATQVVDLYEPTQSEDESHATDDDGLDDHEPEMDAPPEQHPLAAPYEPQPSDEKRSSLLGSDVGMRWVNGCRRSQRTRCKPLRWWEGEHKVYGREHNTLATVTGYVKKAPKPEWPKPSPRTARTKTTR